MSNNKENPVEPFKRAVTQALRSIAGRDDLTVNFGTEPASLRGTTVRLPLPSRELQAEEVAQCRGSADSIALRIAHHDLGTHTQLMPEGGTAKAVFEAAETARVEALGANAMKGVANHDLPAPGASPVPRGMQTTHKTLPTRTRPVASPAHQLPR